MKYNFEFERIFPLPAACLLIQVEADTMKHAHGFARTKAYKNVEFSTPEPEEILIRGVRLAVKQGNLFEE